MDKDNNKFKIINIDDDELNDLNNLNELPENTIIFVNNLENLKNNNTVENNDLKPNNDIITNETNNFVYRNNNNSKEFYINNNFINYLQENKKLNVNIYNRVNSDKKKCNSNNIENNHKNVKTIKKNRCNHKDCNKKLKLTDIKCKCDLIFCSKHRMPENHNCSFNFKNEQLNNLENKLMEQKTFVPKITKI